MAIMLEEIKVLIEFVELGLPDIFGRMPIDYPLESIADIGPFSQPNTYEVRCLTNIIEFYWAGALVGAIPQNICAWPDQALPYLPTANTLDGSNYFYYATGKCFYVRYIDDTVAYCYPIQRVKLS